MFPGSYVVSRELKKKKKKKYQTTCVGLVREIIWACLNRLDLSF